MFGAVVRPIDILEDQFGVGALPEQEVRNALFAAGAYDQIWSRRSRGRGPRFEHPFVQVSSLCQAPLDVEGVFSRSVDNVRPAAVVEGDLKVKTIVLGRPSFRLLNDVENVGFESRSAS